MIEIPSRFLSRKQLAPLRRGSTSYLLLSVLAEHGEMYGLAISRELERRSDGFFRIEQGLLYPTLHRMEKKGWLSSRREKVGRRERKYYQLTKKGFRQLAMTRNTWRLFVSKLFETTGTKL